MVRSGKLKAPATLFTIIHYSLLYYIIYSRTMLPKKIVFSFLIGVAIGQKLTNKDKSTIIRMDTF